MIKPKFWLGLASIGVLVTSIVYAGQKLADVNAGLINDVLHLSTQKIDKIDTGDEGLEYVESDGSLSNDQWKRLIKDSYKFSEELVEQGSVLFKNEEKDGKPVLPLAENERNVTLFGRASKNIYYRSGAGGAAPNEDLVVTLDQAFENCDFNINKTVFDLYSYASRSGDNAEMSNPQTKIEADPSIYTDAVKNTFKDYKDAAIVTILRIGTENTDPDDGMLELHDNEKALLKMIKDSGVFKKTIVMINGPLAMSMDWVNDPQYGIDACLFMGVPGYYGVEGIVHVLMGHP